MTRGTYPERAGHFTPVVRVLLGTLILMGSLTGAARAVDQRTAHDVPTTRVGRLADHDPRDVVLAGIAQDLVRDPVAGEANHRSFFSLASGKSNLSPGSDAQSWFKMVSVDLGNAPEPPALPNRRFRWLRRWRTNRPAKRLPHRRRACCPAAFPACRRRRRR